MNDNEMDVEEINKEATDCDEKFDFSLKNMPKYEKNMGLHVIGRL